MEKHSFDMVRTAEFKKQSLQKILRRIRGIITYQCEQLWKYVVVYEAHRWRVHLTQCSQQ